MIRSTWRRRALGVGAALIAVLASGCVTTAEQGRRMRQDIDALQVQTSEQAESLRALNRQVAELTEVLSTLSGQMESLGLSARRNDADLGATVDRLMMEIQGLRGGVEELRYHLDRVREEQEQFQEATERRFAALKGEEALEAFEAEKAAERAEKPDEPGPFLAQARSRLEAGEVRVARRLLQDFLERWPNDRRAPEAQLLLADTWWREEAWRGAIQEYNNFLERWPQHAQAPLARLRIGEAFGRIGLKQEAGRILDDLIKRYPDSPEARQARIKKKELGIQ